MKLYKYKSLRDFDHVMDILLNERLYCSLYKDLNDPFEGVFWRVLPSPSHPIPIKQREVTTIDRLFIDSEYKNICSLSASNEDVRLWSYYADNHKGIAIEIDFEGLEDVPIEVKYLSDLQEHRTTIFGGTSVKEVLANKTKHWEFEQEYRIVHNNKYFPVTGRIISIYLGSRISDEHTQLLKKCISKNCADDFSIYITKLNSKTVTVEKTKKLSLK